MNAALRKVAQGLGIGLLCALAVGQVFRLGWFEAVELWTLDWRFQTVNRKPATSAPDDIVIVAIDQGSIEYVYEHNSYRWPWPRAFYGKMIDYLAESGARAIVFDLFFSEPDIERDDISGADSDAVLTEATAAAGCVYHAAVLKREDSLKAPAGEVAAFKASIAGLALDPPAWFELREFGHAALPQPELTVASRMVGFVNIFPERDNVFRRVPLLVAFDGLPIPSMGLAAAWNLSGRPPVTLNTRELRMDRTVVPVDRETRPYLWWYGTTPFPYLPAAGVLRSAIQSEMGQAPQFAPAMFKDKIVFFGSTAPGLFDVRATPLSKLTLGVEIQATLLANLLRNEFVSRLQPRSVLILLTLLCLLLGAALRGIRHAMPGVVITVAAVAAVALAGYGLLAMQHIFLDVVPPAAGALATMLSATLVNYLSERKHAHLVRNIFEHYLDRSVVKTLINNPDQVRLGGERRECTVVFSDVADFTNTSEKMQPEQVVQFMNVYLDAMTQIIIEEGGFVDKFVGDEIVAIFGAPHTLPDHAARACSAIVHMRAKVQELQPAFREIGCPCEIFARSGISTGELIVGNMGSQNRMNYTAMGDVMNLGARLEGANKIYHTRILVSDKTALAAREQFLFRELDLVQVKGKDKPVRIYELAGTAGEVDEDRTAAWSKYAAVLAIYRAGEFKEAMPVFETLAAQGDATASVMAERCHELLSTPPPNWNGVYVMPGK